MINTSIVNRSCKTVNQNCFGQFGLINLPVALSEIIFYNTLSMHGNSRNSKMTNITTKQRMHLSLQLLVLFHKNNIEDIGHLF